MRLFEFLLLLFVIGGICAQSTTKTQSRTAETISSTTEATVKDVSTKSPSTDTPKKPNRGIQEKILDLLEPGLLKKMEGEVTKFMKFFQVIPDVIDEGPKYFLKITYDTGVFADRGIELTPAQVKNQPLVIWDADPKAFYTLLLIDPDAPTRVEPTEREWQHWVVTNIPGDEIEKGDVLTTYIGAAPPEGTGLHRYVFLLYKQAEKMQFDEKHLSNEQFDARSYFTTKNFVKKYNLGVPIAGNFFQSKNDSKTVA